MARITKLMKKWSYIAVRLYKHCFFMVGGDGRAGYKGVLALVSELIISGLANCWLSCQLNIPHNL
jgi:hypothetical protein